MSVLDRDFRARYLSERKVLISGVRCPMWYLGKRVAGQRNSEGLVVPDDSPASMMMNQS